MRDARAHSHFALETYHQRFGIGERFKIAKKKSVRIEVCVEKSPEGNVYAVISIGK